jgi:transcriptional regulator with XRE-family HTH domain
VSELASELGARVRRERLRQNISQRTLAERAGISRVTVTRMEADGTTTLTNFLSVLVALRATAGVQGLLQPGPAETLEQFISADEPTRQRGTR